MNLKLFTGLCIATIALSSPSFAAAKQETFATPDQAVDALIAANRDNNSAELLKILGPDAAKLVNSGDPAADKESREQFTAAYDTSHKLESDGDNKKLLVIGDNEWPLPIPLMRRDNRWFFDTDAGKEEILNRRIGRNELNVIEICRAYVEAQREYADQHRLPGGKGEYAQHFLSRDGQHNGLYWPVNEGENESPLGPLIAMAEAEGRAKPQPYHGYYYKILTAQSANAHGGAMHYISGGHMTDGFALVAFPAKYGDSGIMTFIVNQNGIVREKNLGANTAKLAPRITTYDPDASWQLPQESAAAIEK